MEKLFRAKLNLHLKNYKVLNTLVLLTFFKDITREV